MGHEQSEARQHGGEHAEDDGSLSLGSPRKHRDIHEQVDTDCGDAEGDSEERDSPPLYRSVSPSHAPGRRASENRRQGHAPAEDVALGRHALRVEHEDEEHVGTERENQNSKKLDHYTSSV